jgi:hypothetical protein
MNHSGRKGMPSLARSFPPRKIADLDRQSASNFLALLRDSKNFAVTLALGAGVAASAGLPSWNTLLKKICAAFFYHWEYAIAHRSASIEIPPREMSVVFFEEAFWSEDSVVLSSAFTEQDALLAAQQIKNCIREVDWRYLLRKILYNYDALGEYRIEESNLLRSLAGYCAKSQAVRGAISYNWDNLFERQLKEVGIKVSPIWESKQDYPQDSLPVYHPHGYLPLEGGPVTKIILAESDYHQEATEIYSWANLIQTQAFCNSVCIFIGTSLVDPNIRRLLDISAEVAPVSNYAFLPSPLEKEDLTVMSEALFDRDLYRLGVKTIRFPIDRASDDPYSRLPQLIGLMTCDLNDEDAIWRE